MAGVPHPMFMLTSASLTWRHPAFGIVVGVDAVLPLGAVVVDGAAKLADVFDDHVHAVSVTLAQMAAAGVVGPSAAQVDYAAGNVVLPFALLAPAVVLELQQHCVGEGVVAAGYVDVVVGHPGQVEYPGADVVARHPADRAVLVVEVAAGLGAAALDTEDVHGLLLQVPGPLG